MSKAGRELRERALDCRQCAERACDLGRYRQAVFGHDPKQVGEHAYIGRDPSSDVTGHEPAERPLERRLVEFVGALQDLEQCVVERRGIATIDRQ